MYPGYFNSSPIACPLCSLASSPIIDSQIKSDNSSLKILLNSPFHLEKMSKASFIHKAMQDLPRLLVFSFTTIFHPTPQQPCWCSSSFRKSPGMLLPQDMDIDLSLSLGCRAQCLPQWAFPKCPSEMTALAAFHSQCPPLLYFSPRT